MNTDMQLVVSRAAQQMHRAESVDDTLEAIVRSAAEALPAFDHIGVSTVEEDGQIVTRVSTSVLVLELDELQYSLHEGPCVASMDGEGVVAAPRIREDPRWPNYLPGALEAGLKAQLGVRLHLDDSGTFGSLNLYSTTQEDVDPGDVAVASFLATHASLALAQAHRARSLRHTIATRERLGQAVGILMGRYAIDEQAAQAFLWRASVHSSTTVVAVAAQLVAEADVDAARPR